MLPVEEKVVITELGTNGSFCYNST